MRRLLAFAAVLSLALVAPVSGDEDDYRTTEGRSEPIYTEVVNEEYRVTTKWGTIYGVVERPVVPDGVKVPVILTYSPYWILDRPLATMTDLTGRYATFYVPRGYARAEFDLVGTRESSGCYDHGGIRERETARDVVEFLGTQEWSNGKVGMVGASYDGTTQWAAAIEDTPHLTTIVPQVAISRWYDYAYGQGVRFFSGFGTPLLFDFGFGFVPPTGVTGGTAWAEAVRDHLTPCERVEHNQRSFLPDPVYDGYWDERDYAAKARNIKASVLLEGSWADINVHPVNSIQIWNALPANHPKKLVMGLKGHAVAQLEDTNDIEWAWFDHWLLGLKTDVMDLPQVDSNPGPVRGERFQDSSWPPPATVDVALKLGRGEVGRNAIGLTAGELAQWTDRNPVLSETDVLNGTQAADGAGVTFLTRAVERPVRISGTPVLDAYVTTSGISTYLTPVLYDESDTGTHVVVTRGLLNSRNRDGERTTRPLAASENWRAQVRFQPVDWVLAPGHRLGLAVMSMNSNEALYGDEVSSTNDILLDGRSRLIVPSSRNSTELGTASKPPKRPLPPKPVAATPRPTRRIATTGAGAFLPGVALIVFGLAVALRRRRTA